MNFDHTQACTSDQNAGQVRSKCLDLDLFDQLGQIQENRMRVQFIPKMSAFSSTRMILVSELLVGYYHSELCSVRYALYCPVIANH